MRVEGKFQPYLAMTMSFICTCGYYAVNEVAIELPTLTLTLTLSP